MTIKNQRQYSSLAPYDIYDDTVYANDLINETADGYITDTSFWAVSVIFLVSSMFCGIF